MVPLQLNYSKMSYTFYIYTWEGREVSMLLVGELETPPVSKGQTAPTESSPKQTVGSF